MALTIKTSNFEGPFDLLLHLIKKNQMDIYNISILEITNQYISYLSEMKELDLDIASEFIVMATTLIEMKSKVLLPKKKEQEEEEVDDTQELIDKLLQYKKFKGAAEFLAEKQQNTGISFTKRPEIIEDTREKKPLDASELLKDITMMDLYKMYMELIEIYKSKMNESFNMEERIKVEVFKIEDKMEELKEVLQGNRNTTFASIVSSSRTKTEVIVTFLALLELIKLKNVKVVQHGNFSEIYLEGVETNE